MGSVLHFGSVRHEAEAPRQAFGCVRLLARWPDRTWQTAMRIAPESFLAARDGAGAMRLIETSLGRVSPLIIESMDWILSIPPVGPRGFAIDISRSGGRIRGLFAELEEEFETLPGALAWVARALSGGYQLRRTLVGGKPRAWYLEPVVGDASAAVLAGGRVSLLPFFRPRATDIRRNSFAAAAGADRDAAIEAM